MGLCRTKVAINTHLGLLNRQQAPISGLRSSIQLVDYKKFTSSVKNGCLSLVGSGNHFFSHFFSLFCRAVAICCLCFVVAPYSIHAREYRCVQIEVDSAYLARTDWLVCHTSTFGLMAGKERTRDRQPKDNILTLYMRHLVESGLQRDLDLVIDLPLPYPVLPETDTVASSFDVTVQEWEEGEIINIKL